jgi:hypothetical protein
MSRRPRTGAAIAAVLLLGSSQAQDASIEPAARMVTPLDVRDFRPAEGPTSPSAVYYSVVQDDGDPFLRGTYLPGMETVTMGIEVPKPLRQRVRYLRWRWRVRTFPTGGDECRPGLGDSPASVNAVFKRGLRWYILKYVWSSVSPLGATCDRKRSLTLFRDTIVLGTGGKADVWRKEVVDVRRAFIDHFGKGDPHTDIPDFVGVGLMTDGDQTQTAAGADWSDIELVSDP